MLWDHEPQGSISTAFSSSPKLSPVFLQLDRDMEVCFQFLLENTRDEKKENNLLTLIMKNEFFRDLNN